MSLQKLNHKDYLIHLSWKLKWNLTIWSLVLISRLRGYAYGRALNIKKKIDSLQIKQQTLGFEYKATPPKKPGGAQRDSFKVFWLFSIYWTYVIVLCAIQGNAAITEQLPYYGTRAWNTTLPIPSCVISYQTTSLPLAFASSARETSGESLPTEASLK